MLNHDRIPQLTVPNTQESTSKTKSGNDSSTPTGSSYYIVSIQEEISEELEKERRKNNLIIFNMSNQADADDHNRLSGLFEHITGKPVGFFCCERIGKQSPGKVSLILVKFFREDDRHDILCNSRKLRDMQAEWPKLSIAPDRTKQQQQVYHQLRNECEKHRKNGENVIVLNNHIVKNKRYPIASMNSTTVCPISSSNDTQLGQIGKLKAGEIPIHSNLHCIFLNARSLKNRITELYSLLDGSLFSVTYDLIFICETWLTEHISDGRLLYDNNYNVCRNDRSNNIRGGGVGAFIKKKLIYFHVQLPQQYLHSEVLCIDILCNNYKHRFICVNRPHSYDAKLTCDLINCSNFLCNVNFIVTICGDFNFPNIDWTADIDISTMPLHAVDFAHFIVLNGLSQLVKEPTLASNFLDLLLVGDPLAVYNVSVGSPFSTSDHCVIMWNTWFPLMQSNLNFMSHDFKRADFNMISQFLGSIDWVNLFISVPPNDVNGVWLIFKSVIMQAIALHVPKRTHSRKHTPHYPK